MSLKEAGKVDIILRGLFALALKNFETDLPIYTERFVVQVHSYHEKYMLINTSSTIWKHLVRIFVTIAAMFKYRTQQESQAYLQANEDIIRELYVDPPVYFQLVSGNLLRFIKTQYCSSEYVYYWNAISSSTYEEI